MSGWPENLYRGIPIDRDNGGRKFAPGCGIACPHRDWVNGTCDLHGPSQTDLIAERAIAGFLRDLARITGTKIRDNRDEK